MRFSLLEVRQRQVKEKLKPGEEKHGKDKSRIFMRQMAETWQN
jgi:hypothetical protein